MKLYATIEAEKLVNGEIIKVQKKQGSNTALEIIITGEDGKFLGKLGLKIPKDSIGHLQATIDFAHYVYVNGKHWLSAEVQTIDYKAREKCAECGENMYELIRVHHHTENGVDVTKVKKQKDVTKDCICIDNVLNKHCKATLHDW